MSKNVMPAPANCVSAPAAEYVSHQAKSVALGIVHKKLELNINVNLYNRQMEGQHF